MNEIIFYTVIVNVNECVRESKTERARAGSQIKLITVRTICGACIFIKQCVSKYMNEKKKK